MNKSSKQKNNFYQRRRHSSRFMLRKELKQERAQELIKKGKSRRIKLQEQKAFSGQIKAFWAGEWNDALLIHPSALSELSGFINYRFKEALILFKKTTKDPIEYSADSLVAWLFYQWILLAKGKQSTALIPSHLPHWLRYNFLSRINIESLTHFLIKEKKDSTQAADKASTLFKKESAQLKASFSKALGEGLLQYALDQNPGENRFSQIEELFTAANLLIEFGNHIGIWDLCFINSVAVPFHEDNPLADINEWKRALRMERALEAINKAHKTHFKNQEFMHSRLVISLMFDSYILHEHTLKAVIEGLNTPKQLNRLSGQIVMPVTRPQHPDKTVFISPITEIYYRQYLAICKSQQRPIDLSLTFPSQDFYDAIGFSPETLKLRTFKSWKHSALAYFQLKENLSGLPLAYLSGKLQSHTLKPHVFKRLFGLDFVVQEPQGFSPENFSQHDRLPRTILWSKLRASLGIKHIKKSQEYNIRQGIKQQILEIIDHPNFSENESLIAHYALSLIDKSHGKKPLSPTTILTHIDAFGLALILNTGKLEIIQSSEKQRQDIYLNGLETKGLNPKRYLFYLMLFENWLIHDKKLKAIPDYAEIFYDIKKPEFSVDANIISFDEYINTREELLRAYIKSNGNELRFLQSVILLILGFKLDLRRSEGILLHSKDYIYDPESPNLFVKPHEKRSLKTNNAVRTFHIEEHLDQTEIGIFKEYLQAIESKIGKETTYLFPDKKTTPCPPDRILKPLLETLKSVTKDSNFKFHNLRHSKASWDMLAIHNAQFDLKLEEVFFEHMPATAEFLMNSTKRWSQAVHTPDSYHKAPFYLHRQMGHGSLSTTMKNYIHTMDFAIAGLQRRQAESIVTIKWASQLGVASKTILYEKIKTTPLQSYLLEKIFPWAFGEDDTTLSEVKSPATNGSPSNQPRSNDSEQEALNRHTLIPLEELRKLKPFRLFELFHRGEQDDTKDGLKTLGLNEEELFKVNQYYIDHKVFRMKFPTQEASQKRLIGEFLNLPSSWQSAILDESFFNDEAFSNQRDLLARLMERMTLKMDDSQNPLSTIKELDLIFGSIDEAKPIVTLTRELELPFKCKFMNPKKGEVTWQDWQTELQLTEKEINSDSVVKAQVGNSCGRLTLRLIRNNKTGSKNLEAYLMLNLIHSYTAFTVV